MIPTHSHIFGAWVEAGLIGAVFWVFVLRLIFRSMRRALDLRAPTDVLILLTGAMMIWDVFFSPFGANERLSWAAALVLLIFGNQESPPVADVASCTTSRQISSS
jgi:O-antigen ligase